MNFKTKVQAAGVSASLLAASIAAPVTMQHEGLRLKAYLDSASVPTICYGETENVRLGDAKTERECDKMFEARLGYFSYQVWLNTDIALPPVVHASVTSFTYNIGVGGYKKSQVREKFNAGDLRGGCQAMMNWYRAGGKDCRIKSNNCYGLITRRMAERDMCLSGV